MVTARPLLAVAALFTLAGCGAAADDEASVDDSGSRAAELSGTTGRVFNTGGDGLNVRAEPNTRSAVLANLKDGTTVAIECQTTGDSVEGTNVWNFLPDHDGFVSDAFLWTGHDGFIPGVPKCDGSAPSGGGPGGGADGDVRWAAIEEARSHAGYRETYPNCNKFSTALGNGCVEWCSDFVRYAWGRAGADTAGLSAYSMDFRDYGLARGTWKPNDPGVVIEPGDAIVWGTEDFGWGAHVAMVTDVSGDSFRIIHGNFDVEGNGTGDDLVYETGWTDRWNTAGTGYRIVGFISPVR